MAEVLGEWRRAGSPCGGALVLWLNDLMPGAGWGLLDHHGAPKVAHHHLRRACAPVAVWSTDEGLGGIVAHVANDGPAPLTARLRVSLYRDFRLLVDEAVLDFELGPHGYVAHNVETLLGRFVDASWAYRFGPPAQDLVALSLECARGRERGGGLGERRGEGEGEFELLSQSFRFPAGRPRTRLVPEEMELSASVRDGCLHVASAAFAYGVRVSIPGWEASDDAFGVEPGRERVLPLTPAPGAPRPRAALGVGPVGELSAVNLAGRVEVVGVDRPR